jgi:glycosyltransferase involved in cell wall biosynthesis
LRFSRWRKWPVLRLYHALISRRCVFHSTCDAETEYIRNQFKRPVRIIQIPNYVEIAELAKREPSNYLLYVGRIHRKKAIDSLIKSLALSQKFLSSAFILKIAGTGDEQYVDGLKQLANDLGLSGKVEFVGHMEGAAKDKLYADAYWTFMPSHTENFGLVVLESLAQNTPVLASKESPWKILEDEKIGFWTDNSPETLAQKIDEIIAMPAEEYDRYRQRGRAFVEENFDIETNVGRWDDLYSSLAEK